ncbi:MAG: prolipoprotein diacylglyceryl transferase [Gemmatimonadota bacterium]
MLPVLFHLPDWFPFLGGEAITSFGVMMFLSFMAGAWVLRAEMARENMDPDQAWDLVFMAVLGGILGAKLYYILLNYPRLVEDPAGLIFSRGGLVWYGGLMGGAALVIWQIRRMGLPLAKTADLVAPVLAIGYAVGRIGCFLVGDDYGRPTDSWVGIKFPEGAPPTRVDVLERYFGVTVDPALVAKYGEVVPVHPTQLYEVGLSLIIFAILWKLRRHLHAPGWLFMLWLSLAGAERFFVEFFRVKDDRFLGAFTLAQVISVVLILLGIWGMNRLRRQPARTRG